MSEIMSNRILFLEDITKARAPMVEHEAIYFLSACTDSVRRLIDDFDGANKLYKRKRPEKLTCVCVCVCVFSLSLSLTRKINRGSLIICIMYSVTIQEICLFFFFFKCNVILHPS
jgi:hypothetical protein